MPARRYPIRIGRRSALLLRILFGVTPERAWAAIEDGTVSARFGRFEVRVPVSNVTRWRIEGPWRWITAIGVRRSVRHGDVSFAGSPRGGVRLDCGTPVHWTIFDVPAFYVGVEELEAFAAALAALGIPGEDARTTH
ncbi:MAG: hypothetical protein A2V85_17515 [Chloroflexi bacterium RBG_16_72_14]|nr:MAG: hypothetical protein A2V85_17515 [Chloroflexi bacterium RBG_16_72_14]